ncbi:MAG: hypothetical protein KDI56_10675 [Xanthomonadales bacterium]|nr:hypothetical protein [Xanthomonadales bacterium]
MSLAWYISAEREVEGLDMFVNGKAIAHVPETRMNAVFKALGVTHLMEYFGADPDEMSDMFGEFDDQANDAPSYPDEEWFSAADGLVSVRALADYLRKNPGTFERQEGVLEDLVEYERVLSVLSKNNVRWHLAIDI